MKSKSHALNENALKEISLKEKVVSAGVRLVESGLIARTWGNVSCRIDENHFAITASGRDYLTMTTDDIVIVQIDDLSYSGEVKPSGEKAVHAEIYKGLPDAHFVIHTHQENASIIGTLGIDMLDLKETKSKTAPQYLGERVICAHYGLPGTKKLKKAVAKALSQSNGQAIIMKNHGAVCFGTDDEVAFNTAYALEQVCTDFIDMNLQKNENLAQMTDVLKLNIQKAILEVHPTIQAVVYSELPFSVRYSKLGKSLLPYVDDFAQIVGTRVKTISQDTQAIAHALKKSSAVFVKDLGAVCIGENEGDANAVQMILEKNAKARICGLSMNGNKSLSWLDTHLMRFVYLKKYAKQIHPSNTHPITQSSTYSSTQSSNQSNIRR